MTKKDFQAIADVIASIRHLQSRVDAATDMAAYLSTTNPRFDRQRFLTACNAVGWGTMISGKDAA